jgi:hypothetical protein
MTDHGKERNKSYESPPTYDKGDYEQCDSYRETEYSQLPKQYRIAKKQE